MQHSVAVFHLTFKQYISYTLRKCPKSLSMKLLPHNRSANVCVYSRLYSLYKYWLYTVFNICVITYNILLSNIVWVRHIYLSLLEKFALPSDRNGYSEREKTCLLYTILNCPMYNQGKQSRCGLF